MSVHKEPEFLSLVETLRDADVALTNTEMLFHDYENSPTVVPGGTYMRADPRMIDELQWMGINMVATANNHQYDYGENGLITHLGNLEASGLVHAGIGRTMGDAREPCYLETSAGRVALIAATSSGPAGLYAGHQWRDGKGRPGANMIRHTSTYTVDSPTFEGLKRLRDEFNLNEQVRGDGWQTKRFRDHSWGMAEIPDNETEFYMADLHSKWQYIAPNGYRFRLGDRFECNLIPNARDIEENLQRIRDARRSADWVIVSMHNHEQGSTVDDPSDVAVIFAHAAIDAGADVFHGHGPHRDRGIEIYKGRPIFYSIGHFIFQNETVSRMPIENMLRQGLDPWESVPADFFDSRSGVESRGEWLGYAKNPASWRDIVAIIEFHDRGLAKVVLQPIDLGFKRPRYSRGRPGIALGAEAQHVLGLFQRLSSPLGTEIQIGDDVGEVRL
jgi:poly-gamma-glutamate capsule biosynthesis protein CapA/YwtB (metallophosphatase superfamily)